MVQNKKIAQYLTPGCHVHLVGIGGVTDHYSYSMKDQERVRALSDVPVDLMVEKTPFFIWSTDLQPMTVDKTLNTSDIAPTLLNLFGLSSGTYYIGHDAFDPNYAGYAIFSDGSWIDGNVVYQDGEIIHEFSDGAAARTDIATMNQTAQDFIEINNLILENRPTANLFLWLRIACGWS